MKLLPIININNKPANLQTFKGLWGSPYSQYLEYGQYHDLAEFLPYHPFDGELDEKIDEVIQRSSSIDTPSPTDSSFVLRDSKYVNLSSKLPFTEEEYKRYKKDFVPGKVLNETEERVARGLKKNGLTQYLNEMHECLKPVPWRVRLSNFIKKFFR